MRLALLLVGLVVLAGCAGGGPAPAPGGDTDSASPPSGGEGNETQAGDEPSDEEPTTGENGSENASQPKEDVPMKITSPAFEENETIPAKHTCDRADTSPALNVTGVPDAAATLALIADDPDAPREEPWVHWLIWGIPAEADTIPEGYPPSGDGKAFADAKQGTNSFSSENQRYRGPCPPEGHGVHRYRFTLYALDTRLDLEAGADRGELEAAMDGHVLETDRYVGTYEK